MSVNEKLKEVGFEEVDTGGNCTALELRFVSSEERFMITCELSVPTEEEWAGKADHDILVIFSYYLNEDDEGISRKVSSFDDVVQAAWDFAKIELTQ